MRRSITVLILLASLLIPATATRGAASGTALDEGPVIVSGAVGQFYGYLTPAMVVQRSGELTYAKFDIVQHDVGHDVKEDGVANKKKDKWCRGFDKGACPLFWSARAGLGETVPVQGLKNLKTGEIYTFFCTLHPGMQGKLAVTD